MNCQEFEITVNDLAQAELMNADVREPHLAHAKTCVACAARLADERALAAGLRAFAADSEGKDAPPRIEAALLAAFRQQSAPAKTNVVAFPVRRRRIQLWALAAAAVLLVACAIAASQLLKNASSEQPKITLLPSPSAVPVLIPLPSVPREQSNIAAEIADPDGRRLIKPRKKPMPLCWRTELRQMSWA